MAGPTLHVPRGSKVRGGVLLILIALAAGCTGSSMPSASSSPFTGSGISPSDRTTPSPKPSATKPAVPRPRIVSKPIPFPDSRKQDMLLYAQEHYGLNTFALVDPRVIVEHFTGGVTFGSVFNTFAANEPHLGEPPGTCSHFVIDTGGTIYQLVPLNLMCRHTVGLNHTAIGIEMVGQSDQAILDNPPQLTAALDLTLWLMQRYGIDLRNVIGHNESLSSPLRNELVPALRCQTHQDWNHADMDIFRGDLSSMAERLGVPVGPPATPVVVEC